MNDFLFLMDNWRFKGYRVLSLIAIGAIIGGSILLASQCQAQISPATRPHTHAGASSGGSTLAPSTLSLTGALNFAGTALTSPYIFSTGTVNAVVGTSYGILTRATHAAQATNDILRPISADNGVIATGTFTGLTFNVITADGATYTKTGTGTIDTAIGLYASAPTIGTNNLALRVNGTIDSTKACAANYTRIGPNFCLSNANIGSTGLSNNTCTTVAAPSGAKAVQLSMGLSVFGGNVLNQLDSVSVQAHISSACTTFLQEVRSEAKELVAENNVEIVGNTITMIVPTFSGNFFLKAVMIGGAGNTANYSIVGYFD